MDGSQARGNCIRSNQKSTVSVVHKKVGGTRSAGYAVKRILSEMTKIDKAVREGKDNLDGSLAGGGAS